MVAGQREAVDAWVVEMNTCKTHLYMHTGRLQNICAYIVQAPYPMHETRRCNNHQGIHVRLWE